MKNSDYWNIYRKNSAPCMLSQYGNGSLINYGIIVLGPVFLSTFFVLYQWWKIEPHNSSRLVTFLIVICQFWPQYQMFRIIFLGLCKQADQWRKELDIYQKCIGSLGLYCCLSSNLHLYIIDSWKSYVI